jgi:hypothetical protein
MSEDSNRHRRENPKSHMRFLIMTVPDGEANASKKNAIAPA